MVILVCSVQSYRKICAYPDFLRFFRIYTVGVAYSLNSTFDNMPIFTNRYRSLFISSFAANGTLRLFLKMGRVFSFCSNFALILVYLPRPAENTSGKLPFSSILIFSATAVIHSNFWQNVLNGWSQRLNFWNQSDPNKFYVFFSLKTFNFLVIPFSDTGIIISPSNFFCLLLPFAPSCLSSLLLAYLIFSKFVSLLLIDQSQSLTEILPTYLVFLLLCITNDFVWLFLTFCMSDSVFNYFSISTLWALMFEFIAVLKFFYDRGSLWSNVLFHSGSKRWVCLFVFFWLSLVWLYWNFG